MPRSSHNPEILPLHFARAGTSPIVALAAVRRGTRPLAAAAALLATIRHDDQLIFFGEQLTEKIEGRAQPAADDEQIRFASGPRFVAPPAEETPHDAVARE